MKLPVFKAIGTVFAFVLQHWLDILRIVWLPVVLMIVVSYFVMPGYTAAMAAVATGSAASPEQAIASLGAAAPYLLGLMLAGFYVYLVVYAGLLKLVIRGEKPSLPFYLGFGADEFRLLGTFLLTGLILAGVYMGVLTAALIVGGMVARSDGIGPAIIGAAVTLAFAVVFFVVLWLAIRLSLAAPAAIGAQTIGVGPSWSMTKGNAWRLFAYWLIWCLLLLVLVLANVLVTNPGYFQMMADIFSGRSNASEESTRIVAQVSDFGSPAAILRLIFGAVFGILMMAFLVITGGVAYRLMTDEEQVSQF